VLLGCALAQPVAAKKLFSYQDENGRWHFSDTKPDTDADVSVERIKVHQRDKNVYVRQVGANSAPTYQVQNLFAGPIEIEFRLVSPVNTIARPSLPRSFVVPANTTVNLFSLHPRQQGKSWSSGFSYIFVPGSPKADHTQIDNYQLPYARGARYPVSQGFNGEYSHNGLQGRYAVDFAMPDGTPVHAARQGTVMDVARDYYSGGVDRDKFGARANFIRILHDDGTHAIYAHLRWESVLVVAGNRVRRGQVIAKSGSTGFSSGPHLHFAVQQNDGMRLVSIPFRFKVAHQVAPVTPQAGDLLIAQ